MSTDRDADTDYRVRTEAERLRSLIRRPNTHPLTKALAEAALEDLQSEGDLP